MRSRFALLAIYGATIACSSQTLVAQPFEPGVKVQVNTSVFNGQTMTFDSGVRTGRVIDRQEFAAANYDVATGNVTEIAERVYIVDFGDGHRLVREIYLNGDVKPDNPADALHEEIALQRGTEKPLQRSKTLDSAAAKLALAIANLADPAAGANLSVQDVGKAIGLDPANVGVIVSIGHPSAQTVVYGLGSTEATGWIDDPYAWATLFNERSSEVGVGAAAMKGRAQNLEGPATGLVWVTILTAPKDVHITAPKDVPEPIVIPQSIPVGEWAMHQYQGPDDETGKIIGTITVVQSGEYRREVNGKVQTGTLSVADGMLTVVTTAGKRSSRPIVPLEIDGKVVGYELSDAERPIEWLVPRAPVAGQIPVGVWAIQQYEGANDQTGQNIGKIEVKPSGEFQREVNGKTQSGTLSVADDVLTLKVAGGDVEQRPIVPLQDEGKLVGYELSDAERPIEWLVPRTPVPGKLPVGTWAMHEYAGPDDKTGQLTGKITVEASGQFQCDRNGETQRGVLSVADNVLTMQFEGGDTGQWPIVPLQDGNKLVGYELSDEQLPVEWLVPRIPVPGKIPVGTWAMHEYAGPDDKTGQLTGKITVEASGQFQCDRNGETQRGVLSVADNVLTMQFEGGETEQWPITPLEDGDNLVGYELSDEENPIEWLVPRKPVAGQIPVGTWAMHEYQGQDDQTGQLTGKITVDASGKFQCKRNGEMQTGMLSVADGVLTMQFEGGDTGQWPIAPLQDGIKLVGYELSDAERPIEWLVPRTPVPGKLPVGTWAMHEYAGPDDKTGQLTGKITVDASGQFQCERNGEMQRGMLSVADGVLTMQFEGGDAGKWPIAPLQDRGKLVGYRLNDQQNPIQWLVPRKPVAGQIPVGSWVIQTSSTKARRGGLTIGKVTVNKSGEFQCEMNGETQTGKLSVAADVLTMQFESGETGKWPIVPLQDGDKLLGYELRDEQEPMKWLVANDDLPATEQSTAEQPVTEEPVAEASATEESATEESITEESITEESTTEESTTEESTTEESTTEESTTEESTTEEPAA